ncbi:MAG: helix-turn-helix transcriptional regulator [Clostridia bacterium]|nr:helix-turn-helix transcriptional regulator [Clostridia bacterium]
MKINLKEKLRSLRQQRRITQEALANHLGITPQSVGKWERGEGFPDITLLPKIALYFGVTVDELLCVDQLKIEETIESYQQQSRIFQQNGENEKLLTLWEKAYSEFPNNLTVMENLMFALNRNGDYPCPKTKASRIIELGEKILERSTDSFQRENVIEYLCYTYSGFDEEKALQYANMSGTIFIGRETLKARILRGEEGVKACQGYISTCIRQASMAASLMINKINFSVKEKIEAYTFAIDIIERLYSDGNVGFFAFDLSYFNRCLAMQYIDLKEYDNALKALENSVQYAVIDASLKDMDYTAPMVNRLKHSRSNTSKNYKGNACNLRLCDFDDKAFDCLRNNVRFNNALIKLKKHAD